MAKAIVVEGVGKRYELGTRGSSRFSYRSLREQMASRLTRGLSGTSRHSDRKFWALRDVSFDVQVGERLGIIGRNGAGKSTLLKVLSRVTAPTVGRALLRGRAASLLEVGTGFHPELSGRDNIALNGAILGMSRREIRSRTDEIVAFAGVERFLDTPVKRYSSGMYLRLAFAVAAHLEPDILFVDEVLAVGDAEFQKRCLGRMKEISEGGRTVVFVSHSTPAIIRLCERVILLEAGTVAADGSAVAVTRQYLDSGAGTAAERAWESPSAAPGDDLVRLKSVRVCVDGRVSDEVDIRASLSVEVEYWQLREPGALRPSVGLHFTNDDGILLFVTTDFNNEAWSSTPRAEGIVTATCTIPGNFLAEGRHAVLAAVCTYNPSVIHAAEQDAVAFVVVDRTSGDGVRGDYREPWPGVVRPMLEWHISSRASLTWPAGGAD